MSQMTQVVNFMPSIRVTDDEFKYVLNTMVELVEEYLKERNRQK